MKAHYVQGRLQTLRFAIALFEKASELLLFMPTHLDKERRGGWVNRNFKRRLPREVFSRESRYTTSKHFELP